MNKLTVLLVKLNALMAFAAEMSKDADHPINTSDAYIKAYRTNVGRMHTALLKGLRETDGKGPKWPDPDWARAPLARDFFTQHERRDLVAGGYVAAREE